MNIDWTILKDFTDSSDSKQKGYIWQLIKNLINKGDRKLKTKIVLLPLDERPCNYEFPMKLFSHDKVEIVRPKKLGNKKTPASFETIVEF